MYTEKNFLKNYFLVLTILVLVAVIAHNQISILNNANQTTIAIVQGISPCPGAKNFCENERQLIYESHLGQTKEINDNVLL